MLLSNNNIVLYIQTSLFKAVMDYTVPPDRLEDLPLSAGCIVRALSKDGPFYCVSTLDEPPRQGWVPEHILENVNRNGKANSGTIIYVKGY
jgi:hypothetical protein